MQFFIMVLLGVSGLIATDIYVPSLPAIGVAFQQLPNQTELTLSLFLVGFAFSQLIYGPVSDRVGRKPVLTFGALCFILGSILCMTAPSFLIFCIGRIVQGLAAGCGLSITRVILRDCYKGVALAVKSSQLGVFICLTPAVAPLLGGVLQNHFGFRVVFGFLLMYGLVMLFLLLFMFKEPIQHREQELKISRTLKHYRGLFSNFEFMHYVFLSGLAFSSVILYANIVPFIVQDQLHLSAQVNGFIMLLGALGMSISSLLGSYFVKRTSSRNLLYIGMGLLLSSGLLLFVTAMIFGPHLTVLVVSIFLTTLSCGLVFPNGVALAFEKVEANIGIAGAVYGFTQTATSMIMNFVLNGITHQGQGLLGGFYIGFALVGFLLLMLPIRERVVSVAV